MGESTFLTVKLIYASDDGDNNSEYADDYDDDDDDDGNVVRMCMLRHE